MLDQLHEPRSERESRSILYDDQIDFSGINVREQPSERGAFHGTDGEASGLNLSTCSAKNTINMQV
jgi:hypothetical protein